MSKLTSLGTIALLSVMSAPLGLAQTLGPDIYKSKCAMCHGADGMAATPAGKSMKTPPFNSPETMKMSDADLIAITKKGKGKMPAYAGKLTDPQIKAVVEYVETLQKK